MISFSKKLLTTLLAAAAVICLVLGLLFTVPQIASADTVTANVAFSSTENTSYLDIQDGVFKGLKDSETETATLAELLNGKTFSVALPSEVTSIGEGVVVSGVQRSIFGTYSSGLVRFTIPSDAAVTAIGANAFLNCNSLQDITIPASVKTIGEKAFQGCTSLTAVNYAGAALTTIGASAFSGCNALTRITVPANVTTIGTSAFSGCTAVTEVYYYAKSANAMTSSPFGIGNADVTIGQAGSETITVLPNNLFRGTNIKSVTFTNVSATLETSIGQGVFENCTSLTSVNFGNNCKIKEIRETAFNGCTALSEINLDGISNLEIIGQSAFSGCTALLSITIPSTVTEIRNSAFNGCTGLLEVQNNTGLTIVKGDNVNNGGLGYYAKNIYSSSSGGSQFVTTNGYNFFYYNETSGSQTVLLVSYTGNATELTLPASVTLNGTQATSYKISDGAFRNDTLIRKVNFSAAVSAIGANAFMGCTALEEIEIPRTVNEVGDNAFYGCTSLKKAVIEDSSSSLSIISSFMFGHCTALESVVIPKSVRTVNISAFEGCTKLSQVTFNATNLTKIDSSAFKDCVSLEEIVIPATVTTLGGSVFSGCTKLVKAYLPARLSSTQTNIFANCADNLLLIAPDSEAYGYYCTVENLSAYTLTYEIELELYEGTQSTPGDKLESEYRYFNIEAELPEQEGYVKSVWYSNETHTQIVDKATLNSLLQNSGTSKITLYSIDTPKPTDFTANANITYDGNNLSESRLFTGWTNNDSILYTFVITRYLNIAGDEVQLKDNKIVKDAGTYYLSIILKDEDKLGQWEEGVPVTVKVNAALITTLDSFEWGVVSGNGVGNLDPSSENETTTIYIYDNKPYLEKQYQDDAKTQEMPHEDDYEYVVHKSWLSLISQEYTLVLKGDSNYGGTSEYIDKIVYSGNTGTGWGIYVATATVSLDNNYRLPTGSSIENGTLKNQGITVEYGMNPNEFIVAKVWYIIASDGNKLLSADRSSSYTISGWTYSAKGDIDVPVPVLLHEGGTGNKMEDLVMYTLAMYEYEGSAQPAATFAFKHSDFELYINGVMPAGYYVLSVSIKDCTYEEGNDTKVSPGTGISLGAGEDKPYTYSFTVGRAALSTLLKENGGYLDTLFDNDFITKTKTLYADYSGAKTFGDTLSVMPVLTLTPEQLHPLDLRRTSAWGGEEFDKYYTGFEITYRIVGDSGIYGTLETYTNAPYEIGRYSINYNVYAPSYDESFNDSSASRSYTLYIQGTLSAPTIYVEYTGKSWAGSINFNSKYFEVIYLNDGSTKSENIRKELIEKNVSGVSEKDDYINAGTHKVVLMLNEDYQSLAKWNASDLQLTVIENGRYGTYAIFTFTISKATNSSTRSPQILNWEWGSYDKTVNIPQWSTQFVTGIEYNFMLVSKDDSSKVYYYEPLGDEQLGFDKADWGYYWLKPIASGTDNVREFNTGLLDDESEWFEVLIEKGEITWELTSTPRMNSWKYGDDKDYTAPTGKLVSSFAALQGVWTNYFCLYTDYIRILNGETGVTTYPDISALQASNEEGFVPAGDYVYVYELKATDADNFKEWLYPVYFSVLKANNYWDVTPVIHDREYGDESKLTDISFTPHFGDAKKVEFEFWYIDENGIASPLGSSFKDSELEIGKYEYRITLESSANYNMLVFNDYFYINKAVNSWEDVPNVIGWSEGRYKTQDNAPVAQAKFGTVFFTIKNANGDVVVERVAASELNSEKLNSLGVGTYTLVAEVAGTANYEKLYAEAHFAVFEDSVGMTGLIAATIVFALIAVGLAVAGVILLIRKNKKMEEEFRRIVRSEMKRR